LGRRVEPLSFTRVSCIIRWSKKTPEEKRMQQGEGGPPRGRNSCNRLVDHRRYCSQPQGVEPEKGGGFSGKKRGTQKSLPTEGGFHGRFNRTFPFAQESNKSTKHGGKKNPKWKRGGKKQRQWSCKRERRNERKMTSIIVTGG